MPSSNVTSVTHSGRRVVIERAVADMFASGAMTASSTSSRAASARRRVCRPSAWMPSSLVRSTRNIGPDEDRGPNLWPVHVVAGCT